MTVKELIKKLQSIPDKKEVVTMSCDPEGNEYSPLARVELEINSKGENVISLYPTD